MWTSLQELFFVIFCQCFPGPTSLFRENSVLAFEVTNIDTETPKEMSFPVSTEAKQKLDNNVTIPKEIFASAPGKGTLQINVVCFEFKGIFSIAVTK